MHALFNGPAHADLTMYRRSRALSILTILASAMVGLLALIIELTIHDGRIVLFALVSCLIYGTPYLINRTGRIELAVHVLLAGNVLVILASALINRTAIPAVFFMGTLVVIAGAFGRPRTPLLWAAGLTGAPFLINVLLYGAPIAPSAALTTPEGFPMQSIWRLELVALGLLWILASASALATWLLGGAVGDSRAAAATATAAQQALLAQQADLAQRNAQLVQAQQRLETANAELAHAARHKDEFLASMSHELRTPLNTILGMAETLQEGVFGAITPEQSDSLHHIEESGRHLLALINDILDLSKVEAGKFDLDVTEVAIAPVCEASLRLVKQTANQKRLTVALNLDRAVSVLPADPRRLKQMLVNLLANAVKFTPEGGAIGLDVVGDTAAQCVRLTVWDTGIGIAADDLAHLFQPFVQLDSRLARQYAGTGLGLVIVQRMAALHGGSVAVESMLGQGSRFTITLPWTVAVPESDSTAQTEPGALLDAPEQPPAPAAPVILLAEDDENNIRTLTPYLAAKGYQVVVARNGVEALERVHAALPALILMDIQMPGMDGLEAMRRIRADPTLAAIPIIALTALAMAGDRERCLAAGANDYLSKPVSLKGLVTAIDAHLHHPTPVLETINY